VTGWRHGAAAAVLGAALAAPAAAAGEERLERFQGTARGEDGAVRYREAHEVRSEGGRPLAATTTYRGPGGEALAVLRTDFSRDPFAPGYRFEDRRSGLVEEVAVSDGTLTMTRSGKRRALPSPSSPARPLVAGQGLDRLVRARLAELEAGAEFPVTFAVPSRLDTFAFRVRSLPGPPGGSALRVRVEIESWVLRLFAGGIDCDYDRASGRLVRYRGPSNLLDEAGEAQVVTITYAYPEPAAEDATAPMVGAALERAPVPEAEQREVVHGAP